MVQLLAPGFYAQMIIGVCSTLVLLENLEEKVKFCLPK